MRFVAIDGNLVSHMSDIHEIFCEALDFPDYYGRNLDALYDCLSDLREETVIGIANASQLKEKLVSHYGRLLHLLDHVESENRFVRVVVFRELSQETAADTQI